MDCCVLSAEEVGRLRHYDIHPNHEDHVHINSRDAIKGVMEDSFELVESKDGRYFVTPTKMHFLRAKKSGHITVIQRVVSNQLLVLKPIR